MKNKRVLIISGITLLVCIIAAIIIVTGTNSTSAKASKELDLGNKYLLEGNYKEAILAFNKVIEIDPKNIEARMGLADTYIKTGELDEAETRLQEVLDIKEEYTDAYLRLADVKVLQGDTDGAIALLEEALNQVQDETQKQKLRDKLESLKLEAPQVSMKGGSYDQPIDITLASIAGDWTVYYTLDGSEPNASAQQYKAPIHMDAGKTVLKAVSIASDGSVSKVLEEEYDVGGTVAEASPTLEQTPITTSEPTPTPEPTPTAIPEPTSSATATPTATPTPTPKTTPTPTQVASAVKLGDYVYFGRYLNEPILWRVININSDGNPVLFSEKIITYKAFDAAESGVHNETGGPYSNDQYHQMCGSNNWVYANLREWLNSSSQSVKYSTQPPIMDAVVLNPYANEPGFLNNFTLTERSLIQQVNHRVCCLDYDDQQEKDGGNELLDDIGGIPSQAISNEATAIYKNVTDKIYLLSIQEVAE